MLPLSQRSRDALYELYGQAASQLRSRPSSVKLLFGFEPAGVRPLHGGFWDWSTLALRQALLQFPPSGKDLLEVGTGAIGVLAIFAALRLRPKSICAADVIPENIVTARAIAERCGVHIRFVESDLFRDIPGVFDVIVFNPPYVDAQAGRRLGLYPDAPSEARSNGGRLGLEVAARFLKEAPAHLRSGGTIFLGLSDFHVGPRRAAELIERAGLLEASRLKTWLPLPSSVYALHHVSDGA